VLCVVLLYKGKTYYDYYTTAMERGPGMRRGAKRPRAGAAPKRKRARTAARGKIGRAIVPKMYVFKRKVLDTVIANNGASPGGGWLTTGDLALVTTMIFALNQLPNSTDFTNLFAEYRIKRVRTKIYCGWPGNVNNNTATQDGLAINIRFQFSSNRTGQAITVADSADSWAEKQMVGSATRGFQNEKPVILDQGVNQLSMVFHTAVDTDYVVKKPSWQSTNEPGTPYYGYDLRIEALTEPTLGLGPGGNYRNAQFKLEHEFELEFRGVK